jgi:hypothetical protein
VSPGLSYPDFSSTTGLQLGGNAAKVGNALRLSTAIAHNAGNVFTTSPVTLGNSFSTQFQFRITNSAGNIADEDGPGADGLVFVIQSGNTGFNIGYGNPSLGIEFDTFNNGTTFGDPNGNHVGIDFNGNIVSVATQPEPTRFNNGQVWNAWVDYNGTTDRLEVRWSMSATKPTAAQLTYNVDLPALLYQDTAYVGFTSATGGGWGDHDLLSWVATSGFTSLANGAGDYNNDGVVNAADYLIWRKTRNTNSSLANDTTPGSVTNVDYDVWRSNLGVGASAVGAGTTVPEPTLYSLFFLASLFGIYRRSTNQGFQNP